MKKLYIQPALEVETMETLDIIATSPKLIQQNSITGFSTFGKPTEGNGENGTAFAAKGNSLWDFEDDEEFD